MKKLKELPPKSQKEIFKIKEELINRLSTFIRKNDLNKDPLTFLNSELTGLFRKFEDKLNQ